MKRHDNIFIPDTHTLTVRTVELLTIATALEALYDLAVRTPVMEGVTNREAKADGLDGLAVMRKEMAAILESAGLPQIGLDHG